MKLCYSTRKIQSEKGEKGKSEKACLIAIKLNVGNRLIAGNF